MDTFIAPQPHIVGALLGFGIIVAIFGTIYWMLHPAATTAERAARETEREVGELVGSIIVVFAPEIRSENMMALAARIAQRDRAQLLAAYIIEVPLTLPVNAEMEDEHREALTALATAEAIGRSRNVEVVTEVVMARQVSQGVLDLAKKRDAHLLIIGAYHEGKYAGAPLGRAIENIVAGASADVLIGIQGRHGRLLTQKKHGEVKARPPEEMTY